MEILADVLGYMVSIDSPKGELESLEKGILEGEILLVTDKEPYNVPTNKKLTLRVDPSINEMLVDYYPAEASWDELQRVDIRISPKEYERICFGKGRVFGTRPRLSTDIIVQDINATI